MDIIQTINFGAFNSSLELAQAEEIRSLKADLYVADSHTAEFLTPEQRELAVIIPPGESEKVFSSIEKIMARAVEYRLDRGSLMVGVGGGVICDMTAFAASLYMRGCQVELVPTTLLAMVDAAVGGKTGVDYGSYKNMLGSFYPARRVIFNPNYVNTLPEKEYLCGLAEAIKSAFLGDRELLELLETERDALMRRDPDLVKEMVLRCVRFKAKVVEEDLKENGVRASLNLGHTFGHALESVTGFSQVSHGEGVAWGMAKAAKAALVRGDIDREYHDRIINLLENYGYKLSYDFSVDDLMEAMGHDKKIRGGKKRFILPAGLEKHLITELDEELVREILTEK
ncbi:MAG: 3-dehydroquinate synthase [Spirochaetales bacterium]|nr:3-dehydroquinate synthase [Spirochaetales bacterium]